MRQNELMLGSECKSPPCLFVYYFVGGNVWVPVGVPGHTVIDVHLSEIVVFVVGDWKGRRHQMCIESPWPGAAGSVRVTTLDT